MKMRALSMMLCVCLAIGAMAGCSSKHPVFPGSQAESDDGGTVEQAGEFGGEEYVRENEVYLKKAVTYDLYGNTTEHEYDRQGSLIKMTVFSDRSYENSVNTHRKESEYDNFGNVLREVEEGVMSYKVDSGDLRAVPGYEEDYYSRYTSEASYEYDAAGNLIRKSTSSASAYDRAVEDTSKEDYSYKNQSADSMVTEETYEYDVSGNVLCYRYTSYQKIESGRKSDSEFSDDSREESETRKTVYESDDAGRLLREMTSVTRLTVYKADDSEKSDEYTYWTEYEYDDNDNLVRKNTFNDPDFYSDHVWIEYKYDDGGNLFEICEYSDDEEYIRKTEFEYDARSNVIKSIYYYGDREMHRTEYTYDEAGNKTGETYYENGDIRFQTEYSTEEEYNDAGLLIKSVSCENGKVVSWTEYEYE